MQDLKVFKVRGIRVLTTKQIAEAYGTDVKTIQYNFRYNKGRYKEGKHYIEIEGEELRRLKTRNEFQSQFKYAKSLYLWTEKGALLHAKSLNTDKAWEVYDYLVDFYFRAKEDSEKKEVVPVTVSTKPIPDELSEIKVETKENHDAISVFKILMKVAESKGLQIKTKELTISRSRLHGNRIAVRSRLSLEEVNYEIAFELFHAVANYDKGDMLNTPLAKYYHSQAERAADLIIKLLNTQVA